MNQKNKLFAFVPMLLSLLFLSTSDSHAIPYASSVSESAGTVTFYLNESADVQVVFAGPASTNNLGALSRGSYNFPRGAATSYQIQATKSAAPLWTQISDDTNSLVQFFAPLSVSINRNPKSPHFGRIYVLEDGGQVSPAGTARLTTEGIFVLNADISDAFSQGDTGLQAGLSALDIWAGTGTADRYDPFQIEVGEDDYIYIADANDPRGALLRADPTITSGEPVLEGIGNTAAPTIHTVLYGVHTKGSLATSNLVVWATDGQWVGANNAVLRWDVGVGPLPYNTPPVLVAQPGPAASERDSDLDVAPDGNIFVAVATDGGTGITGVPAVQVFNPTGTLLWSSTISGADVFTNAYSLEVSPDNTKLAIIRRDRQTWVVGLTNGPNGRLPDLTTTNLIATFTVGAGNGRCVNWDLAGNLYVANRSTERLRIFSPGGTTTAITKSDGTFNITVPANTASISNSVASLSESSATPIVFTVNRTGNTAVPLTVSFLFTGTASNGLDHTTFPTSITFPAGVTSSNITVTLTNDSVAEFTETLTVALNSGTNYGVGTPASATTTILDDETPAIQISTVQDRLLEGYSGAKATYRLTRLGLLTPALSVNLTNSGTAVFGTDYTGPTTISIGASVVNVNFNITNINDVIYEGNETAIRFVASGSGYVPGVTNSATVTVIEDEFPPGTVLFSDDFETNSVPRWIVNAADPTDAFATFGWDYGVNAGIPPASGSATTKGLRFQVSTNINQVNAISTSPLGGNFTGDYRLIFNMWINYNGALPDGGNGSTQNGNAGVGTSGDHPNWYNTAAADGIWFSTTGDGADGVSGGDYNAFIGPDLQNDDTGFYGAGVGAANSGLRDHAHPFYSLWGGVTAPAAQLALYTNQTGVANIGNAGMAWHTVVITKVTNTVIWTIDGINVATVTNDVFPLSTNVFVGYSDKFSNGSLSTEPAMSFGLIDNLRVETFSATVSTAPHITRIQIIGGNVQINFTGAVTDAASAFTLQSSITVNGIYGDTAATITGGSGSYQAVAPLNGATRFYQIKR